MNFSKQTPPAFLVCGEDDLEIAQKVPELFLAIKRAGVSAELHIFAHAGHGFGLRASNSPPVSEWPQFFLEWLGSEGFLKHKRAGVCSPTFSHTVRSHAVLEIPLLKPPEISQKNGTSFGWATTRRTGAINVTTMLMDPLLSRRFKECPKAMPALIELIEEALRQTV